MGIAKPNLLLVLSSDRLKQHFALLWAISTTLYAKNRTGENQGKCENVVSLIAPNQSVSAIWAVSSFSSSLLNS